MDKGRSNGDEMDAIIKPIRSGKPAEKSEIPASDYMASAIDADLVRPSRGEAEAAVKTLLARGYVDQQDNPTDGRSRILSLSKAGWCQLQADPLLSVAERIDMLDESEKRALASVVKQLIPQDIPGQ